MSHPWLDLRCKFHPNYKGIYKPRIECPGCIAKYSDMNHTTPTPVTWKDAAEAEGFYAS